MEPVANSVTPIFAVADIDATIAYYESVIGASDAWKWGDPPTYAGCRLGSVWIHFSLDPELCARAKGTSLFINVLHIESLHEMHQNLGAKIVDSFGPRPWGCREYTVEDCNGIRLRFSQSGFLDERRPTLDGVKIVTRQLQPKELLDLMIAVNWSHDDREESLRIEVEEPLFTAVAEYEDRCIGTASVLGHKNGNYLVFNVIVHPDFQSQGVGKRLMSAVDEWLTKNGIPGAMVKLFTGLDRQPFYQQFGFRGPEHGLVGMSKSIPKKD
ncbi:MAG: GNAT family N-acetyltransferase [Armatimonadetes bacterium]|nr:GNAT family N-acetyltransferase [Armatimonadota bacterium]MBS1725907.1 GNAT family N-acetyltransferase [Armatimonadota bacterium]